MWRVRHIIWLSYYSVCKNKRLRCKSSIQWHGVHGQHDITTTSMGRRNFTMLGDGPPRALSLLKALCLNTCLAFCLKRFFKFKALVGAFNKEKALLGALPGIVKFSRSPVDSSIDNMLRCVVGVTGVQITEEDSLMQGNCVRSVSAVSARWWRYPACDDKCSLNSDPCTMHLELQTNVRKDFTITEKAPIRASVSKSRSPTQEKKKFYHHFSNVKYSYLPNDTFKKLCWNACIQEQIDFEVPRLLQALMCV